MSASRENRWNAVLELHGLTRRYGEVVALDDVSFTVDEGQMFDLVVVDGGQLLAESSPDDRLVAVVDLPPGAFATLGLVLAWFLLGYAFYSVLFAVAGAVVSRQEELQNTATPLNLVLFASFFAAISALRDPGGTIAKVASFLPPVAPLTMPVRVAGGEAAGWEIVVSVLLTLASIALLVPLSARLYAGAVLRTGARVKLRAAWTASRG